MERKKAIGFGVIALSLLAFIFSFAFLTDKKEDSLGVGLSSYTPEYVAFEYDLSLGESYVNVKDDDLDKITVKVYKGNYSSNKGKIDEGITGADYELDKIKSNEDLRNKLGVSEGIHTVVVTRFSGTGNAGLNKGLINVPVLSVKGMGTTDLRGMFKGSTSFNQDITSWDVSNVKNMDNMLEGATSFNHDLFEWKVGVNSKPINFNMGAEKLPDYKLPKDWQESYKVVFKDRGNIIKEITGGYYKRPLNKTSDGDLTVPKEPIRETHWFERWESSEGIEYGESMIMPDKDVIYEAQWRKKKVEIDTGDGTTEEVEVDEDGNITLPTLPDKEGEDFDGWVDENGDKVEGGTDVDYTEGDKYTPIWKPKVYTVRFESEGRLISEQVVKHGDSAVAPSNPSREGYLFEGWDKVFSNIIGNITVNAKWKLDLKYPEYADYLAQDSDFSGTTNGSFKYIGNKEVVYIPHKIKGVEVTSYNEMFRDTSVKKVISDNPNVTNMRSMFNSSQATSLDLSSFDTSQVTYMYGMFRGSQATSLDLSSFDTSQVANMYAMFHDSQATSLDLSSFDTSKVRDMRAMFNGSPATSLDLSSFDTSQVTNMFSMFSGSRATSLDLSSFDTSKVTDMNAMFYNSQATSLDLSSFDTSRVTDMRQMFRDSQATSLDLSSFNTSKVTNMRYMFQNSQATSLDLSSFDTSQVTNMQQMFRDSKATSGYARTQADANKFNSSSGKPASLTFIRDTERYLAKDSDFSGTRNGEFRYIGNQEVVYIPHKIKGVNVTSYREMFRDVDDSNVKKVISDNPNVTDMQWMFRNSQATSLDLSSFDTSNVTTMYEMFQYSRATSLDLSSFDTSNVTNMNRMFSSSRATSLDLSSFNTSKVTYMVQMFYDSRATSLDLSSFDTSKVMNMDSMFENSQATSLDLSSFDTSRVTNMRNMFNSSQATSLDLSSFDTSQVTDMRDMFQSSPARRGYARTQADADRFNSSSSKPSGLTFTVK